MTIKKGDYMCNLCYVRSIESLDICLCLSPGLFLWKKTLKHCKEHFVGGCWKQDKVAENGVFHTLRR